MDVVTSKKHASDKLWRFEPQKQEGSLICFFYCLPPLAEAVDKESSAVLLLLLKTLSVTLMLAKAMSTSEGSMIWKLFSLFISFLWTRIYVHAGYARARRFLPTAFTWPLNPKIWHPKFTVMRIPARHVEISPDLLFETARRWSICSGITITLCCGGKIDGLLHIFVNNFVDL